VRAAAARRRPARAAWLGLVAMLAAAALLPGGRAALAALALALAVAPGIALWRAGRRGVALLWPGAVLGAAAGVLAVILADPTLTAGLRTVERLAEGDVAQSSGRLALWRAAMDHGAAALPFGLGTGGFTMAAGFGERRGMYPHNHALEALAEGGLPGALLWLLAFGGGGVAAVLLGARTEGWRAARIAALVLPVALSVMVSTDLGNRMAWFALGLALGLGVRSGGGDVRALRQAGA
jgi:O-antigen ligase